MSSSLFVGGEFGLHPINFRLLSSNDPFAQFYDPSIFYWGIFAHEQRCSMMRDHRPQKFFIRNPYLASNSHKSYYTYYHAYNGSRRHNSY